MSRNLIFRCYYLDEPLSREEQERVCAKLARTENLPLISIKLQEIRVPHFRLPGFGDEGSDRDERNVAIMKRNLQSAGIDTDQGRQVIWVMPDGKLTYWGVMAQLAIMEMTGLSPYVVQRWTGNGKRRPIEEVLVVDGAALLGQKE